MAVGLIICPCSYRMLFLARDEDATPRCSSGQGRRFSAKWGNAARSCAGYGEAGEDRETVAVTQRPSGAAPSSGPTWTMLSINLDASSFAEDAAERQPGGNHRSHAPTCASYCLICTSPTICMLNGAVPFSEKPPETPVASLRGTAQSGLSLTGRRRRTGAIRMEIERKLW